MTCDWIIREGTRDTFWAYTPCKSGFNYLSKVKRADQIQPTYDGRSCPICGKPIKCNMWLLEKESEI